MLFAIADFNRGVVGISHAVEHEAHIAEFSFCHEPIDPLHIGLLGGVGTKHNHGGIGVLGERECVACRCQ